MQSGQRPVAVGFFFSLGHSTVVVRASLAIASTTSLLQTRFAALRRDLARLDPRLSRSRSPYPLTPQAA